MNKNENDIPEGAASTGLEKSDIGSRFSARDTFEEWSRYIGLVMLIAFLYIEIWMDKPLNDIYLIINAALLAGDKLTSASEKIVQGLKK